MNIQEAIHKYLELLLMSRSPETARTYGTGLDHFSETLQRRGIVELSGLDERALGWMIEELKGYSSSAIDTWASSVISFFGYLIAERLTDEISLDRARMIKRQRIRRQSTRFSQYPMPDIEKTLAHVRDLKPRSLPRWGIIDLRDKAIFAIMSTTGLRNSEVRALNVEDLEGGRTVITGKGNKQAVIRFSPAALAACFEYLAARGEAGPDEPLFENHDKKSCIRDNRRLTSSGLGHIVKSRATAALGRKDHELTVHALRHYFVTTIWQQTGNLVYAQRLARHANVQMTLRYTHSSETEIDQVFEDVFCGG